MVLVIGKFAIATRHQPNANPEDGHYEAFSLSSGVAVSPIALTHATWSKDCKALTSASALVTQSSTQRQNSANQRWAPLVRRSSVCAAVKAVA
ncbi:MAG TPA: hypothetical protein VHX38_38535 [Pseudonocardiaceae bacterium]|jgi:hypothetical protein|nr:hypothetical protein [Pseudonocardiaceae bacterium]